MDNVQEYHLVYEGGIARQSILKVGTAATAIHLDDCKPGATFDLQSHLARVAQKKRKTLQLDRMQSVRPIWYEFLDDGIDRIKAFRVLPAGLSSHHRVVITIPRSRI